MDAALLAQHFIQASRCAMTLWWWRTALIVTGWSAAARDDDVNACTQSFYTNFLPRPLLFFPAPLLFYPGPLLFSWGSRAPAIPSCLQPSTVEAKMSSTVDRWSQDLAPKKKSSHHQPWLIQHLTFKISICPKLGRPIKETMLDNMMTSKLQSQWCSPSKKGFQSASPSPSPEHTGFDPIWIQALWMVCPNWVKFS